MKSKLEKFIVNPIGFMVIVTSLLFLLSGVLTAQPQAPIEATVKKVIASLPYSMVRFEANDKLSLMEPKPCRCRPCCGTFEMWQSFYEPAIKEKMSLLTEIKLNSNTFVNSNNLK